MNYGRSLLPATVGFDRLLSTMEEFENTMLSNNKVPTYPPYNIIKETDTTYTIEIAVSGFKREDIEITSEGNKLYVNGAIKTAKTDVEYLHRGIGTRDFSHKYTMADTVIVKSADMVDGLLVIKLENMIPEEKKPRKIEIGDKTTDLLTE
jgi:molecular chaperone IbpA